MNSFIQISQKKHENDRKNDYVDLMLRIFFLFHWYREKSRQDNMLSEWLRQHSEFFLPLMVFSFSNPLIMSICWSRLFPSQYFQMPIQFKEEYKLVGLGSTIHTLLEDIPMIFINIFIIRDSINQGNQLNVESVLSLGIFCFDYFEMYIVRCNLFDGYY